MLLISTMALGQTNKNLQGITDFDTLSVKFGVTTTKDSVANVELKFSSKWNYLRIKNTAGDSTDRFQVYNIVGDLDTAGFQVMDMTNGAWYTEFSVAPGQTRDFLLLNAAIDKLRIWRKTTFRSGNKDLFRVIKLKDE